MPTKTDDSIQTTNPGFQFPAGETWTFEHGIMVSSIYQAGVFCAYEDAALINHGTILSAQPSSTAGYGRGVWMQADGTAVTNAADGKILGYASGVYVEAVDTTIANRGIVESFGSAIECTSTVLELAIDNSGIVRGRNFGIVAPSAGGAIHNDGLIEGTRSVGIAGNVFGHGALTIFNGAHGIIRGGNHAISQIGYDGLALVNHGTILGDVYLPTDGGNVVRNAGNIAGSVVLGAGADIFNGIGGKSGAVYGGGGKDTLIGGFAADRLDGAYDNDILTGRGGRDRFVFSTDVILNPNVDRITDFTANVDKIVLDTDVFHVGPPGMLAAARFHVGARAADASDRIIYNPNTGALLYDPDGRGGDPQAKMAQLAAHLALDHADFVVIG